MWCATTAAKIVIFRKRITHP